ncbi:MAG: molybdopterin-dependent oxidoreductase [Burkholderiaceae bacterium]|nr:molybdopterin-dependent oxidoreductase [Burkholderiaceae bacterium]
MSTVEARRSAVIVTGEAPARLALRIDLDLCTGCRSCEVACKQEHRLAPGEFRNRVLWLNDEHAPDLSFFALSCQHCERPACLRACPVHPKAIAKDARTGVVSVLEDRCTGCGECVIACPYSAMGYDAPGHHAQKCDLCAERRAGGETTACASACPTQAIAFGHRDRLLDEARAGGRALIDNDPYLLGPATVLLARRPAAHRPGSGPGLPDAQPGVDLARDVDTEPVDRARFAGGVRPAVTESAAPAGALDPMSVSFPYREARASVQADRVVPGGCNICFNCCSLKFHFRGDDLVRITGNDEDPIFRGRVCPKSQLTLQMYHSEHRLLYPQKRVGARGEGRFERIGWDQALDEIAERLRAVRDAFGPEALGLFVGTRTGLLEYLGSSRLFAQMWGTPNHEGTDPLCANSKNVAFELTQGAVGSGASYTEADIGAARMYLYIGDNQAETRPVHFGMVNGWRIRNCARMVVVDPRLSVTASKADQWLAIRPGTDMALGLALCQHILARGLHDARFCAEWVLGFGQWRDFIEQRGYTPHWAEPITGIAASTIAALAEEIAAADGCVIFASRGVNQHTNGTQTNRVLMFLAAITGNWGRRGGTFFNMVTGLPIVANAPPDRRRKLARPRVRKSPTGWTDAMLHGKPYPIRALIACNNPMSLWPGQSAAREAFQALDLLVHIELFANETSSFADYLLPAASGIEKGDIGRANEDRRVVWIDRMIDPPGEARPDTWIWIELGKRLGFDDVLKEAYKDPAVFWDEMMIAHEQVRGLTHRRLTSTPHRWVRGPVASEDAPEVETLYLEGSTAHGAPPGHRFPTPSGKLEFWSADIASRFAAVGLDALPEFYSECEQLIDLPYVEFIDSDEQEGILSPFSRVDTLTGRARMVEASPNGRGARLRAQGFDTELITGRPSAAHFHSWTHYFWQAQEMQPDLFCQIHPERARALGIADGERVRVETVHGMIEALAWVYPGIRESAVFVPIGWGERQPYHPWRSVNFLTDKNQRDPVSDQTNLKSLLCRISRV